MGLWDIIFTVLGWYGIMKKKNEFINYVSFLKINFLVQHWVSFINYIHVCDIYDEDVDRKQ
jgi:hypothetical protein